MTTYEDVRERFWSKIAIDDGCWEWQGTLDRHGYGLFWKEGRYRKAHRVSYELMVGPIPEGRYLHHVCRNPRCVKPVHLQPTTAADHPDTAPVLMRSKTHCVHGHEFTEENTRLRPSGGRSCKQCERERALRWYHDHKNPSDDYVQGYGEGVLSSRQEGFDAGYRQGWVAAVEAMMKLLPGVKMPEMSASDVNQFRAMVANARGSLDTPDAMYWRGRFG